MEEVTRGDGVLRREAGVARPGGAPAILSWLAMAIVTATMTLHGQQPPRLSGTWRIGGVPLPATTTAYGNSRGGQLHVGIAAAHLLIRQDPKVVEIIEEALPGGPNTLVYRLDGSDVTNPFRIGATDSVVDDRGRSIGINKRIPSQFTSRWNDGRLVSAITVQVPGEKEPRHYEETISLVADGVLTIRIQRVGTGDSRTLYYQKR